MSRRLPTILWPIFAAVRTADPGANAPRLGLVQEVGVEHTAGDVPALERGHQARGQTDERTAAPGPPLEAGHQRVDAGVARFGQLDRLGGAEVDPLDVGEEV